MNNRIISRIFGLCLFLTLVVGADELEKYLEKGLAEHPSIVAARHALAAAKEKSAQVTALPDPKLGYSWLPEAVQTKSGPQEHRLLLSQKFPFAGKLSLQGEMADTLATRQKDRLRRVSLDVERDIRVRFARLSLLGRRVERTEKILDLIRKWESLARSRYETSALGYPVLLKLATEIDRLEDRLSSVLDRIPSASVALAEAAAFPVETEMDVPKEVPVGSSELAELGRDSLLRILKEFSPDLAAVDREIAVAEIGEKLAGRQYYPDLMVGVGTMLTSSEGSASPTAGTDPWVVSLQVNLPIHWGKYSAMEKEQKERGKAALSKKENLQQKFSVALEKFLFDWRDSKRKSVLYRDRLLPTAEQSLEASEAAYLAGKAEFMTLLDAARVLLELEDGLDMAQVEEFVALTRIAWITGLGGNQNER